ncbi:hypothetical protein U1Q18_032193 [Sarracenia purpurea var. burkii]
MTVSLVVFSGSLTAQLTRSPLCNLGYHTEDGDEDWEERAERFSDAQSGVSGNASVHHAVSPRFLVPMP